MLEPVPAQIDFILGHCVEHERIVRIRGMPQGENVGVLLFHFSPQFKNSRASFLEELGAVPT
jgi:hypothetical protein